MTIDGAVVPGLVFLLAELVALAGVGYVIVRVALRETDHRVALAQGLVVGPAIWGVVVNLVMYLIPGMAGAVAGWIFVLALATVLVWRAPKPVYPQLRTAAAFAFIALTLFWIALAKLLFIMIPLIVSMITLVVISAGVGAMEKLQRGRERKAGGIELRRDVSCGPIRSSSPRPSFETTLRGSGRSSCGLQSPCPYPLSIGRVLGPFQRGLRR